MVGDIFKALREARQAAVFKPNVDEVSTLLNQAPLEVRNYPDYALAFYWYESSEEANEAKRKVMELSRTTGAVISNSYVAIKSLYEPSEGYLTVVKLVKHKK